LATLSTLKALKSEKRASPFQILVSPPSPSLWNCFTFRELPTAAQLLEEMSKESITPLLLRAFPSVSPLSRVMIDERGERDERDEREVSLSLSQWHTHTCASLFMARETNETTSSPLLLAPAKNYYNCYSRWCSGKTTTLTWEECSLQRNEISCFTFKKLHQRM